MMNALRVLNKQACGKVPVGWRIVVYQREVIGGRTAKQVLLNRHGAQLCPNQIYEPVEEILRHYSYAAERVDGALLI